MFGDFIYSISKPNFFGTPMGEKGRCCLLVTSGSQGSKIFELSFFIGLSKATILLLLSISSLILKRNLSFWLSFCRLELTDALIYPKTTRNSAKLVMHLWKILNIPEYWKIFQSIIKFFDRKYYAAFWNVFQYPGILRIF